VLLRHTHDCRTSGPHSKNIQYIERGRTTDTNTTGEQSTKNILEKGVGRVVGGSTSQGDQNPDIVVGQEYGRTPYSEMLLKHYEHFAGLHSCTCGGGSAETSDL
jgi:hypothetical protein